MGFCTAGQALPVGGERSDDKRRARLNLISHLLSKIDYERVPRKEIQLPKRQERGTYQEPSYAYKFVPEKF